MLRSLTIRDIVLIDRLQMDFEDGLCVLSGETGAGKSILLAGLSLAIGGRGERELVRHGTDQGIVTADFDLDENHPVLGVLDEQGLDHDGGQVILKRIITNEGRSRAFINDQPVSIGLLRNVGDRLVEIHGQHDERGLLDVAGHRAMLDDFGGYGKLLKQVRDTYERWSGINKALEAACEKLEKARADEDYIRHNLAELVELAPLVGEEEELAIRRTRMMQGETMVGGLTDVLGDLLSKSGVDASLRGALRRLQRMDAEILNDVIENFDQAAEQTSEAIATLERVLHSLDFDVNDLEQSEERLFALRSAGRKHKCLADELPALKQDFEAQIEALQLGGSDVKRLEGELVLAAEKYEKAALNLSKSRKKAAADIDKRVNAELPALKMEKAKIQSHLLPLPREDWGPLGAERVEFQVSTNPGAPFGGLIKIASGGELSRFILALKVVLASRSSVSTLIFDEIDQGVGGAVADAVGERLVMLSKEAQIMVITHSPQVAARGAAHHLISKGGKNVTTDVRRLDDPARREEIARMLSGAEITEQARAAADRLIDR